jgi:hypothetical protein
VTALASLYSICLDANDPQRVAAFWGALLGREVEEAGAGDGTTPDAVLRPGEGSPAPAVWVNGVPEPKSVKDRVHLDVRLLADTPDDVVALGATVLAEPEGERSWWVLADPEGHEFCAFPPG